MTTTDGGSALPGAGAARPAGHHTPAGLPAQPRAPRGPQAPRASRRRTVLALARVEAVLLVRSWLVLAGVLAGGVVIWSFLRSAQPLWWDADWEIGEGLLILAMAVLAAAQLAAGRARRDAMADLYASFPATAGTRTVAHLAGLAGVAPASLLLIAVAAAGVQLLGPIGTPSIAVLAGGLLLVIAAGAAGVAIGTRFSHPLAGMLGALVPALASFQYQRFPGAVPWLLPWPLESNGAGQLDHLPGPLAGYPPAAAHAAELAGLALLAAVVALAVTIRRGRARVRAGLAAAGAVAVAVTCLAGAGQLRPIPTADLNHLVAEAARPASVQRCTSVSQVRYCLYAGFGRDLPALEAPVDEVLAHLPARPGQPLSVRQVLTVFLSDPVLTHGQSAQQIAQWADQLQHAQPGVSDIPPASGIYLPVGSWPDTGGLLAAARFDLALAAAEWAVHLPGTAGLVSSGGFQPCVPVGQAREAVAIWLAILATHPAASALQAGLPTSGHMFGTQVGNVIVPTWNFPGVGNGYVTPPGGGPQLTAAGYLLASAMTRLPQQRVAHVLAGAWGRWLSWRTSDAQLAAALAIPMPGVPAITPLPPHGAVAPGPGPEPKSPVCTG
jgi:hypothetical protein